MDSHEALSIPRRFITSNLNIHGLVLKIKNDINTFFNIINILKENNINLRGIVGNLIENESENTTFFLILDLSNSKLKPKDLINEIIKQAGVANVNILERPSKSLIVDTFHYPLVITKKRRLYIFSEDLIAAMIEGLISRLGKEIGETVLFYIGKEFGRGSYDIFSEYKIDEEEIPLSIFYSAQANGLWTGTINIEKDKARSYIRFFDNFECRVNKNKGIKSNLIRGMWETILSKFYKEEIKIEEIKCIALGNDYCEMKIL